jgi:hypothetical protein
LYYQTGLFIGLTLHLRSGEQSCKLALLVLFYRRGILTEDEMYKKTYLLPIAVFLMILTLSSLACKVPFLGGDDSDAETGSAVEFGGETDSDAEGDHGPEDTDTVGDHDLQDDDALPGAPPAGEAGSGEDGKPPAPFPLTNDADILTQNPEMVTYSTQLKVDKTVSFYRTEFDKLGFTERDLLTVIADDSFSMVFDGHPNGKAILVQGTDFGDHTNISIQFIDM